MQEIWKDIKNYEGLYQISNYGNVRSLDHIRKNGTNKYMQKGKMLKPQKINNYLFVRLSKEGKTKQYLIHRLVAIAFLPNKLNYSEINHKDENAFNNNVNNLEWCSHKYNINYGTGNYRRSIREKGKKKNISCKKAKHKCRQIIQYDLQGNFIREWDSITEASKTLNLKKIWEVCNNKRNKCGNYVWKYKGVETLCL